MTGFLPQEADTSPAGQAAAEARSLKWLLEQWGQPIGIEEVRVRFGELVAAAEKGTITLIARDLTQPETGAALVPIAEVWDTDRGWSNWTLSDAKARLGDVVDAASRFPTAAPQMLTRHYKAVAALIPVTALIDGPDAGAPIELEAFLESGGTVTLAYEPGEAGSVGEDGDLVCEPVDPAFTTTAFNAFKTEVGSGEGRSALEAIMRLRRHPRGSDPDLYSSEPPF